MEETQEESVRRIGIFGGTFDPMHNGHVALGDAAIEAADLDKLIVMPVKIQPFKQDRIITEGRHRLAMAHAAFDGDDRVEVSDYEVCNTSVSYTYDTLCHMSQIYDGDKLFFITGTDSFISMETWHRGRDILHMVSLIVAGRPGYRQQELEKKADAYRKNCGTEVIIIDEAMPDISSTQIKSNIQQGIPTADMLPESVERYIHDNRLYR